MDSDGENLNLICNFFGYNISPQFTPSGNKIIFRSHRGENHDIYLIPVNGREEIRLTDASSFDFDPAWKPVP